MRRLTPVVAALADAEGWWRTRAPSRCASECDARSSVSFAIPCRASAVLGLAPYDAPEEGRAGKLRLDFNENTVGCSPAVLRALRA